MYSLLSSTMNINLYINNYLTVSNDLLKTDCKIFNIFLYIIDDNEVSICNMYYALTIDNSIGLHNNLNFHLKV